MAWFHDQQKILAQILDELCAIRKAIEGNNNEDEVVTRQAKKISDIAANLQAAVNAQKPKK